MNRLCFKLFILACCLMATSAQAQEEGFQSLFDGKSLCGWVQRGGEALYHVEPNAKGGPQIVGTSVANTPNSFLCTEKDYSDFIVEFEVKVDPVLNSGVQFRSNCFDTPTVFEWTKAPGEQGSRDIPAGRVHGYQVEIDPSPRAYSGGIYDEARRGWLYDLSGDEQATARAAFDPQGWNRYRIEAVGDSLKTFVNDVPIANLTDATNPSGFIALQVHAVGKPEQVNKEIRWRNVRIKEIECEDAAE